MVNKQEFTDQEIQEIEELKQKFIDTEEKFKDHKITTRQYKYRLTKIKKKNEELMMFHDLRLGIESLKYAYNQGVISLKDFQNWQSKYLDLMDKLEKKYK